MPQDLLIGISGVGAAIAGFAGIAIVLHARDDVGWAALKAATIKALLETSLSASVFALFPLALDYVAPDTNTGLASLTVLFALWHAWILWLALRRDQVTVLLRPGRSPISPVLLGAVGVIVAQLTVGIGMFNDYLWAAYLLGLFWLLIVGVVSFCLLVYSTLEIRE